MVKIFFVRLSPLMVMCVANLLLWLLLRGEFDSGTERAQVYEYFVMYVFYFTLFVAVFCIAASLVRLLSGGGGGGGGGGGAKAAYFALSIPPAAFSLIVGLLSLSVAFNGVFFAIIPAVLYFFALILTARPELFLNNFSAGR